MRTQSGASTQWAGDPQLGGPPASRPRPSASASACPLTAPAPLSPAALSASRPLSFVPFPSLPARPSAPSSAFSSCPALLCVPVLVRHSVLPSVHSCRLPGSPAAGSHGQWLRFACLAGASHHHGVLCLYGGPGPLSLSPSVYEPVCEWTGQRAGGHSLVTCLCDHLIIYHRGRQCFHKLPRPGAARAGINSCLSPNTQLLITMGEGWPDVA